MSEIIEACVSDCIGPVVGDDVQAQGIAGENEAVILDEAGNAIEPEGEI